MEIQIRLTGHFIVGVDKNKTGVQTASQGSPADAGAGALRKLPLLPQLFALALGLFLGLSLVKLGNPVILDDLVMNPSASPLAAMAVSNDAPSAFDFWESFFAPASVKAGFFGLVVLLPVGLAAARLGKPSPIWLFLLFLIWFGWQFMAASHTVSPRLTHLTLIHFTGCAISLFLGWHALSHNPRHRLLWIGILAGMVLVFWRGLGQHYGGLDAVRQMMYDQPNWRQLPPEAIGRFSSGRIFATFVYPNALAGMILLLLPAALAVVWEFFQNKPSTPKVLQGVLLGLFAYAGLACLFWSGSKAGWLIALGMGLLAAWRTPIPKRIKLLSLCLIAAAGLGGFFIKYSKYFERGATSASARLDYWEAAAKTAMAHPLLGTGPGTFSIPYAALKRPESEMARLVHNDYLEQASDSGLVGLLAYSAFIIGLFSWLHRRGISSGSLLLQAVWLGVLGWAVQGLVEFGLYIPALAWTAFLLMGWMIGSMPASRRRNSV